MSENKRVRGDSVQAFQNLIGYCVRGMMDSDNHSFSEAIAKWDRDRGACGRIFSCDDLHAENKMLKEKLKAIKGIFEVRNEK